MTGPHTLATDYDVYEVAFLAGGPRRAVDTAVVALVESGRVRVTPLSGELSIVEHRRRHSLEAAVLDAVGRPGQCSIDTLRWRLESDERLLSLGQRLERDGLRVPGRVPLVAPHAPLAAARADRRGAAHPPAPAVGPAARPGGGGDRGHVGRPGRDRTDGRPRRPRHAVRAAATASRPGPVRLSAPVRRPVQPDVRRLVRWRRRRLLRRWRGRRRGRRRLLTVTPRALTDRVLGQHSGPVTRVLIVLTCGAFLTLLAEATAQDDPAAGIAVAAVFTLLAVFAYRWIDRQRPPRRHRLAAAYVAVQLALGYLVFGAAGGRGSARRCSSWSWSARACCSCRCPRRPLVTAARPAVPRRHDPGRRPAQRARHCSAPPAFTAVVTELLRREQRARAELADGARAAAGVRRAGRGARDHPGAQPARPRHPRRPRPPPHRRPDAGAGRARGPRRRSRRRPTPCSPRRSSRPTEALAEVRRSVARPPRAPRAPAPGRGAARRWPRTPRRPVCPTGARGRRAPCAPLVARGGGVALPGRPGGAHQRAQARRGRPRPAGARLPRRRRPCGWRSATTAGGTADAPGGRASACSGCASAPPASAAGVDIDSAPGPGTTLRVAVPGMSGRARCGCCSPTTRRCSARRSPRCSSVRAEIEVVGEAGRRLPRRCTGSAALRPDVVLMDLHMPVLDGIAATRRLRVEQPDVRVLALTTFDDDEDVFAALRAGARRLPAQGRLGRPPRRGAARRGPRRVGAAAVGRGQGRRPASPSCPTTHRAAAPQPLVVPLSDRELDVLRLLADGRSNREIAGGAVPRRGHGEEPRHQRPGQARCP